MTRKSVTYKDKKYFYYYCPTGKKGCTSSHMIRDKYFLLSYQNIGKPLFYKILILHFFANNAFYKNFEK